MVETKSNEGKTVNSVGLSTNKTMSNIIKLNIRFSAIKKSKRAVGRGIIITNITMIAPIATKAFGTSLKNLFSAIYRFTSIFSLTFLFLSSSKFLRK